MSTPRPGGDGTAAVRAGGPTIPAAHCRYVIGADVGGTKTALAMADAAGTIVVHGQFATREHRQPDDLSYVAGRIAAFARTHVGARTPPVMAVGCGFPEYVTPAGLLASREVITWRAQPAPVIVAAFAQAGLPRPVVAVDSDVRLGALGEALYGAGRNAASFIYLSLGTGLSCAFVPDAAPWAGQRGEAIAVGEWPACLVGDAAGGAPGVLAEAAGTTLEQYASGTGIARRYAARAGLDSGQMPTARDVSAWASAGDAAARDILASAGAAVGRAAAMLVAVLDPAAVVVGGGLGTGEPLVWSALAAAYSSASHRPEHPALLRSQCGPDAGLRGALALAATAALA